MRRSVRHVWFLTVLLCGLASLSLLGLASRPQRSFAVITGKIAELPSMRSLAGVEVTWNSQKARSDEAGHYQISIPVGIRELSFSTAGHPSVHKVVIARTPSTVTLDV